MRPAVGLFIFVHKGMQQVFRGVLMLLSNGSPISNLNEGIIYMGQGYMVIFFFVNKIIFPESGK